MQEFGDSVASSAVVHLGWVAGGRATQEHWAASWNTRCKTVERASKISYCDWVRLFWRNWKTLFEAMPTAKAQPDVISAAISACERGGQGLAASTLFEAMPKGKVQPDVISYNTASSACEKVGQWQPAFTLFEAMPRAKVQPDVISYSVAISACAKGGQWQEAIAFMLTAKAESHQCGHQCLWEGWTRAVSFDAVLRPCPRAKWSQMSSDCLRPCPRPKFSRMPPPTVRPSAATILSAVLRPRFHRDTDKKISKWMFRWVVQLCVQRIS